MLNGSALRRKDAHGLHDPVRVVCVGRQFAAKDPRPLVRAVADLPDFSLTLVGTGELHEPLRVLAAECGAADRIRFVPAMANDDLCRLLHDSDVFAVQTEHWELSKAVLEAMLTALPVVINRRRGEPVPELSDDLCLLVESTPEGYREGLLRLAKDDGLRTRLATTAADHAERHWSPAATEAIFVSLYRDLLQHRPAG
jgi:glycosyltransferase involved in cell wall biosynthesis